MDSRTKPLELPNIENHGRCDLRRSSPGAHARRPDRSSSSSLPTPFEFVLGSIFNALNSGSHESMPEDFDNGHQYEHSQEGFAFGDVGPLCLDARAFVGEPPLSPGFLDEASNHRTGK